MRLAEGSTAMSSVPMTCSTIVRVGTGLGSAAAVRLHTYRLGQALILGAPGPPRRISKTAVEPEKIHAAQRSENGANGGWCHNA